MAASRRTFGVQWYPVADTITYVENSDTSVRQVASGETKVFVGPSERIITAGYRSVPFANKRGRSLQVWISGDVITALAGVQRLRISGGGIETPVFELGDTTGAITALQKCYSALLSRFSVDPVALAAVATSAEAIKPENWISDSDYPNEAVAKRLQGETRFMWTIGIDGRVSDCRILTSSGHDILDQASCNAVIKRGLYKPARDADGRPVKSWSSRSAMWRVP